MGTRDEYVAVIKSTFVSLGKTLIVETANKYLPFLSLPVIKQVFNYVIDWALTLLVDKTETGIFFLYIDFRVAAQSKEFERAAYVNYYAQQTGTKEQKRDAKIQLLKASREFIALKS